MQYVTKSRTMLEDVCKIKEINGEFYQDKPRAGLTKLRTFISVTNHKYGKSLAYELIQFWNYKTHKGMLMTYHSFLYAWYKGEVPAGYEVDHIDNDTLNNDIDNLQLLTKTENIRKRGGAKNQYTVAKELGIEIDKTGWKKFGPKPKPKVEKPKVKLPRKATEHTNEFYLKKINSLKERIEQVKKADYKYEVARANAIRKLETELNETSKKLK